MLKIQELEIDDLKFRLREPRLKDYLRARKCDPGEFSFEMLAGMLLNPDDSEFGRAAVEELPLRAFDVLAQAVDKMTEVKKGPLDPKNDGSTDSPSPSAEPPLTN